MQRGQRGQRARRARLNLPSLPSARPAVMLSRVKGCCRPSGWRAPGSSHVVAVAIMSVCRSVCSFHAGRKWSKSCASVRIRQAAVGESEVQHGMESFE